MTFIYQMVVFSMVVAVLICIVAAIVSAIRSRKMIRTAPPLPPSEALDLVLEAFEDATLIPMNSYDTGIPIFEQFKESDIRRAVSSLESQLGVELRSVLTQPKCTLAQIVERIESS